MLKLPNDGPATGRLLSQVLTGDGPAAIVRAIAEAQMAERGEAAQPAPLQLMQQVMRVGQNKIKQRFAHPLFDMKILFESDIDAICFNLVRIHVRTGALARGIMEIDRVVANFHPIPV